MEISRLWKLEGDDMLEDAKQMIQEIKGDMSKLPFAIHARLLQHNRLIDEANIANDEVIVMEMKITFEPDSSTPWVFAP